VKPIRYTELVKILQANGAEKVRTVGLHETWKVGSCQAAVPHHPRLLPGRYATSKTAWLRASGKDGGPMKPRKTYRLVVEREPGWWIVQIPELDLTTQARRLGDVEKNAREAIAALLDVGTLTFDLEQEVRPPVAVAQELDEARALMDRAAILREESADRIGQAVDKLIKDFGLTMREAGKLLDLSHQRIAQLVERARRGTRV
jgi:hypothetical protein